MVVTLLIKEKCRAPMRRNEKACPIAEEEEVVRNIY